MATCFYDSLLSAVVAAIQSIGLQYNGNTIPVVYLTDESARSWDTLPKIEVTPVRGGPWQRIFQTSWWVPRGVKVTLIAAGNMDLTTLTSLQLGFRSSIMDVLCEPTTLVSQGITAVSTVNINEDDPFDKNQISDEFSTTSVGFTFQCLEVH